MGRCAPLSKAGTFSKGETELRFALLMFVCSVLAQAASLSNMRQLTHGGQNAEAYWSPDGKRLIFQTTRAPYGCDQRVGMDVDGAGQHLVYTGKGRTTYVYFLKD